VLRIRDPRSGPGMGKKLRSGIRDEHPGSYIGELRNNGIEKYGSGINIPDPQHWQLVIFQIMFAQLWRNNLYDHCCFPFLLEEKGRIVPLYRALSWRGRGWREPCAWPHPGPALPGRSSETTRGRTYTYKGYKKADFSFKFLFSHCFVCHPADSPVSEDARIETLRTVCDFGNGSNHSARSHLEFWMSYLHFCIVWKSKAKATEIAQILLSGSVYVSADSRYYGKGWLVGSATIYMWYFTVAV